MAGYHQFHAVNVAVEETLRAAQVAAAARGVRGRYERGPRQAASRRPARRRRLAHPGLRQEPDDGLLRRPGHPAPGDGEPDARRPHRPQRPRRPALRHLRPLPRPPAPAAGAGRRPRRPAREARASPSGGVVFTTIQKFLPEEKGDRHPVLSDRRNIVVIADEAHRSQYDFIDGFARHMRDALPNASFIGFTGTPIELTDANTRAVFGDYISVYDIQRAVEDGATVPIYYESRLAKLDARRSRAADRSTPSSRRSPRARRSSARRSSRAKWAQLEAVVGTEKRLKLIAARPRRALREAASRRWTARRWSSA